MTNNSAKSNLTATADVLRELPDIPRRDNEPVFDEPWQAEVFALSLSLHEQGVFTWTEWAHTLSSTIKEAQRDGDPDLGNTYYLHWLSALEQLIIDKNLGDAAQLNKLHKAWDTAARNTAHGLPITLP